MIFYKFRVGGYAPKPNPNQPDIIEDFKKQARRVSHQVKGCDDQIGPVIEFFDGRQTQRRALTRREVVFGVQNFGGLVRWRTEGDDLDQGEGEVTIDMMRARLVKADGWIADWVRQTIVSAGWTIQSEDR